nr:unnamed protein product [Digitaria exilis]
MGGEGTGEGRSSRGVAAEALGESRRGRGIGSSNVEPTDFTLQPAHPYRPRESNGDHIFQHSFPIDEMGLGPTNKHGLRGLTELRSLSTSLAAARRQAAVERNCRAWASRTSSSIPASLASTAPRELELPAFVPASPAARHRELHPSEPGSLESQRRRARASWSSPMGGAGAGADSSMEAPSTQSTAQSSSLKMQTGQQTILHGDFTTKQHLNSVRRSQRSTATSSWAADGPRRSPARKTAADEEDAGAQRDEEDGGGRSSTRLQATRAVLVGLRPNSWMGNECLVNVSVGSSWTVQMSDCRSAE